MNALEGLWYDGVSARAHPVTLRVVQSVLLQADTPIGARQWPLDRIAISPRLGSTPRVLGLPDGGRIECADAPELARWFAGSAGGIEHLADWLERRRTAIAIAALLIIAATVAFVQFGLPLLAHRVAEHIPPPLERQISHQTVKLLDRIFTDPSRLPEPRQRQLEAAFNRLVAGEPRAAEMRLAFVRAPAMGPNAFALPDGRIFMTDELVEMAGDDAQILAVLAHEAGHHVHRHGMRQALESSSVFVLAGLLFGDATGSSLAVSVPAALVSNRFSRGHEQEADAYAFELLKRRGRSPRAFAEIMRRLTADAPPGVDTDGPSSYLSSHPPSPSRIAAAERAAGEIR